MNQLITNKTTNNLYNHIIELLNSCDSFIFNVAFINFSGVQLLLDSFKNLEKKGIKGKILTSTYLNFTEPKALKKLKEFNNIKLKIYDSQEQGFHAKAYIFKFKKEYKIIIGSSNLTASAFKSNIEWNIKTIKQENDEFLKIVLEEFNSLWKNSFLINENFIENYEKFYLNTKKEFIIQKKTKANYMQKETLKKLNFLRKKGENKALVIASTGSGKTYLSAFDVKSYKPKKILFLVHRENILLKAKESFENIIENFSFGLYTGNKKEKNCDYLFSTIQTMKLSYTDFEKEEFDYIIVDEAHHIVSSSYKEVLNHFKAKFLLGLTATPNRMDNKSIYEIFENNIACDIRLNLALKHNLIVPFHYYGISDIKTIDYQSINLTKIDELAKLLMVNKRVDYIIEKLYFYSHSGKKRKALGFCASKEHAKYMSEEFNKRGIISKYLTNEENIKQREDAIHTLEDDESNLEVIFTVDIFNEGIDIPSVNTVLFLRPTNSAVIFIQQLGRGLRKAKDKKFLTLLDFIGNHNKSHLISLALLGSKNIDKDSLKVAISNNFSNIKNAFIYLDEISKERIFKQLENENFNTLKYLKDEYINFKNQLNKIPTLCDFINFDNTITPLKFIFYSKSYIEFLAKVEKEEKYKKLILDKTFIKTIRFIQSLLPIKRVYEFIVLKYLLINDFCDEKSIYHSSQKYLKKVNIDTIKHSFNFLNQNYFDKIQSSKYEKLIEFKDNKVYKSKNFCQILKNKDYKLQIEDSLDYGLLNYENNFGIEDYGIPFLKLYEKYNMLDIALLCNFPKIHSSFRGSGFLKYKNDFFLFLTIDKNQYKSALKYTNTFLSKELFTYISKPLMSTKSTDGLKLCKNKELNIKLHIFTRKFAKVDRKTQNFIYLGLADTIEYKNEKPISLILKLQTMLSDKLYEEFTKIV